MNRIISLLSLAAAFAMPVSAQLNGDGYYRVQSTDQGRYISVIDNRGSINVSTTSADMAALRTVLGFDRVVSDPSSIIYIKKMGSGYDLQTQGTGSYSIISYEVLIRATGEGTYWAYASASGMTKYLMDETVSWMVPDDDPTRIIGGVATTGSPTGTEADWYIKPVTADADNYFGLAPTVAVGGNYYQTFYAAFPFTFSSDGMAAYTVTTVDAKKAAVVISELTAGVPSSTPVIVKCSSSSPAANKLSVGASVSSTVGSNKLTGVYFCNDVKSTAHRNVVDYDANTMRVLGRASNGSLAFVKASGLQYIPANTAYITVPADAPNELKVYTQAEYENLPDQPDTPDTPDDPNTPDDPDDPNTPDNPDDPNTPDTPDDPNTPDTPDDPNTPDTPDDPEPPTKEPVAVRVTVDSKARKYGAANPVLTYSVTPSDVDLTGKVKLMCDADAKSVVGEYAITATVAVLEDTVVTCVDGTLFVDPAQLTVTAADAERVYGQENPELIISYAGFVNDESEDVLTEKPTVLTEATKASDTGSYPITVTGGKAANYELSLVDGTLTIAKAALVVTVSDTTRYVGEENPEFTLSYDGFVNDEDETVLTIKPQATTTATAESLEGTYEITVSGGEATNYSFEYNAGTLTVLPNPSGISSLIAKGQPFDVYDLKGRKIRAAVTTLESLPKGVYVVGGQKVVK